MANSEKSDLVRFSAAETFMAIKPTQQDLDGVEEVLWDKENAHVKCYLKKVHSKIYFQS